MISENNGNYEEAIEYYKQGVLTYEKGCVCKIMQYLLESCKINKNKPYENDADKQENYKLALDIFSRIVNKSGIFHTDLDFADNEQKSLIIEQFSVYMDIFPDFRKFALKKSKSTAIKVDEKLADSFKAENYLSKDPEFILKLIVLYFIEPDNLSPRSIKVLTILERICQKNEFRSIALMVGDLYHSTILGICKLDFDKMLNFHSSVKDCANGFGYLRLSTIYKSVFDQKIKCYNCMKGDFDRNEANTQLVFMYEKIMRYIDKTAKFLFPIYMKFYIEHYIKCYHFIVNFSSFHENAVFIVDSVISQREHALKKSLKYYRMLFLFGDKSIMLDYFRVLKFLKYQDAMNVALQMHEKFEHDFFSIPLAICFEKGIGCLTSSSEKNTISKNTREALKIYKQ